METCFNCLTASSRSNNSSTFLQFFWRSLVCVLTLSKASMAGCFLSTFLDFIGHSWSVQKRISLTSSGTLYDHTVWKTPWISLKISLLKVGSLHARFKTNIPENIDFIIDLNFSYSGKCLLKNVSLVMEFPFYKKLYPLS